MYRWVALAAGELLKLMLLLDPCDVPDIREPDFHLRPGLSFCNNFPG